LERKETTNSLHRGSAVIAKRGLILQDTNRASTYVVNANAGTAKSTRAMKITAATS
jgi:hypothetical protein